MHTLPQLPYEYNALEPQIDELTMRLHHTKHHQAYIDKLNAALAPYPALAAKPIEELLIDLSDVPEVIRSTVANNGGGHLNHSLFWTMMRPARDHNLPVGHLAELIVKHFVSFDVFQKQFTEAALGRFGSGWAWLAIEPTGALKILSTANQDSPISQGLKPVLGVDVWEHAYYLKYQNRRADYLAGFFQLINWEKVEQLLAI